MKRMPSGGYTILEVMIFLTVSSMLMTSTMLMVSGREDRTRFSQSVQTFEQRTRDILNDVSTGYYPSGNNLRCQVGAGGVISFPSGTIEQGKNTDCIFLGRAIQFQPSTTQYSVYTMVAGRTATALSAVNGTTQLLGAGANPGIVDQYETGADLQIKKVVSRTDTTRSVRGLAVISDFSETLTLNNTMSGNAGRVTIYEVMEPFFNNAGKPGPAMEKATNGVIICLEQGSGGRKGALILGGDSQQAGTETMINEWPGECEG